jgi:hypothetical protein
MGQTGLYQDRLLTLVLGTLLPGPPRQAPAGRCQCHGNVTARVTLRFGYNSRPVRPLRRPRPAASNVTAYAFRAVGRAPRTHKPSLL